MLKELFNINLPFINENDIVVLRDNIYGDTYTFTQPIEHPLYQNFYMIPGRLRFAISKTGIMIDLWRCQNINFNITKPIIKDGITGGYRTSRFGSRHRMMALAFLELTQHPSRLWVNHKNGIPGDDRVDNLEWVTPSQNVQHAYDHNLHPNKVRSVDVINSKTGETYQFPNIAQASRFTGLSHTCITGRLTRSNGNNYPDGWRFKETGEEWDALKTRSHIASNERRVMMMSIKDNTVKEFVSTAECSKYSGIAQTTIAKACREKTKTPNSGLLFRYIEDRETFPVFDELQLRLFKYQNYNPTLKSGVIAHREGKECFFGTLEEASQYFGYSVSGLRGLIKRQCLINGCILNFIYTQGK